MLTQTYIDQIISKAVCCIAELGYKQDQRLRTGRGFCEESSKKMRRLFLASETLRDWEVGADDNYITEAELQQVVDIVLDNSCCCSFDVEDDTAVSSDEYWLDGYTEDDTETTDSYII